jgi:hypothetical protein
MQALKGGSEALPTKVPTESADFCVLCRTEPLDLLGFFTAEGSNPSLSAKNKYFFASAIVLRGFVDGHLDQNFARRSAA